MVKLRASLISLTLATSLTLALPHPSYTHGFDSDLLEREFDEDFPRREYFYASDDLEARDPSFFSHIGDAFRDVGRVASKGIHAVENIAKSPIISKGLKVAESIAENPLVQAGLTVIPGGAAVVAAEKVIGTIGKIEDAAHKVNDARRNVEKLEHLGGSLLRGKKVEKAIGRVEKFGNAIGRARRLVAPPPPPRHHAAERRRHRRDLEDYEELSRRDVDVEELELIGREYDDDFLVERDFFDDLD